MHLTHLYCVCLFRKGICYLKDSSARVLYKIVSEHGASLVPSAVTRLVWCMYSPRASLTRTRGVSLGTMARHPLHSRM